jgi:hypothetical protein
MIESNDKNKIQLLITGPLHQSGCRKNSKRMEN